MRLLLTGLLLVGMCVAPAFATAQYADRIVFEGKEYALLTTPMQSYFVLHPEKRPRGEIQHTALWRGYVATFEFRDGYLVLKDIEVEARVKTEEGGTEEVWKSVLDVVVPAGQTLRVDWFTGILVLPHGELVEYVHMGFESSLSDYILLEIANGALTDEKRLTLRQYEKFKKRQFREFRKTEAYRKAVEELKNERRDASPAAIDKEIQKYIVYFLPAFLED